MSADHMGSTPIRCRFVLSAAVMALAFVCGPQQALAQKSRATNTAPVERFLDSSTLVIGWADISQIEFDLLAEFASQFNPRPTDMSQPAAVRDALVQLGATKVFWVADLAQLNGGPQAGIVPVPEDKAEAVALLLGAVIGSERGKAVVDRDVVIVGTNAAVAALQGNRNGKVDSEFLKTVNRLKGPHAIAIHTPVAATAPVVGILPDLVGDDHELVSEAAELLIRVNSIALSGLLPPENGYLQITTDSADVSTRLAQLINQWTTNRIGEAADSIQLDVRGNQLRYESKSSDHAAAAIRSLVMLTAPARKQTQQWSAVNSLRQIALAMHNFHDVHGFFPPQALADGKGRRLLSWRVLILPYLDQAELYQQFRLDEPWDSEHNRKLIALMPDVYKSTVERDGDETVGQTRFLAPLTSGSVFGRIGPGVEMKEIKDGTSNTLLVTEVAPGNAVVWTKPADIVVKEQMPLEGLIDNASGAFNACMCDGSVRTISRDVAIDLLQAILSFDGGEVIDTSKL